MWVAVPYPLPPLGGRGARLADEALWSQAGERRAGGMAVDRGSPLVFVLVSLISPMFFPSCLLGPTQINQVVSHPNQPLTITAHDDRGIRFLDSRTGEAPPS